jgi:leader peptidase (prepilin peptidase) / N-methyltransferase
MPVAIAAVAGLIAGSFFNVVIARLPRHESVLAPGSRCPHCGHPVRPYDNVPVVSWLILRRRCRDCGEPISARYPLVELVTAALFAAVVIDMGANEHVWLGLALVCVLVPVAVIDLDHRIIPNTILLPGAVAAIAIVAATEPSELAEHLIAGAAAAGFLLAAVLAYPRGMGMGDVKLAGVLGLYLGRSVGPAILVALLSGTIVGVAILARKGAAEGRKTAVPFGPFLAFGGLIGLFFGPDIVDWYLDSFT